MTRRGLRIAHVRRWKTRIVVEHNAGTAGAGGRPYFAESPVRGGVPGLDRPPERRYCFFAAESSVQISFVNRSGFMKPFPQVSSQAAVGLAATV